LDVRAVAETKGGRNHPKLM